MGKPAVSRVAALAGLLALAPLSLARAQPQGNAIVTDGRTATQVTTSGRVTDITTATIRGGNAFNSFSQFTLGAGNTVNLFVPNGASTLINLVTSAPAIINGILNSYQNGAIGGNVYFADPYGMIVGAAGELNVGAITAGTPTAAFMGQLMSPTGAIDAGATATLLAGTEPISPDGSILIRGRVNATSGVTLASAGVTVAGSVPSAPLATRQQQLFVATVNRDGLQQGGAIVVENGEIKIVAAGDVAIAGNVAANGAPGENAGTVAVTAGADLSLASTAQVSAKGVGAQSNGGKVSLYAAQTMTVAAGATVDASAGTSGNGGSIELSAGGQVSLAGANLFAGAAQGQAGSILIDPTAVVVGAAPGDMASIDSGGANVTIDATQSITIATNGYINTRETGTGVADDATDPSTGPSGNITLSAPSVTILGQINAFAINNGTTYAAGTITLNVAAFAIDGVTQPGIDTGGANLAITATGAITISGAGYINTRQTGSGLADDTASTSTGNSGTIVLDGASLNLAGPLNSFALNSSNSSFNDGDIALIAATGSIVTAAIRGGNVAINAEAANGMVTATAGIDTDGNDVAITAGDAISIASGSYINTRLTGSGNTNDTTSISAGNSGDIALSAPAVAITGPLNAFAIDSGTSGYSAGTITLNVASFTIDGVAQPGLDTGGANLVINATGAIIISGAGYINTRQTGSGLADDTISPSTNDSGTIALTAASIALGGPLNAWAIDTGGSSHNDGDITLTSTAGNIATAAIRGGNITITSAGLADLGGGTSTAAGIDSNGGLVTVTATGDVIVEANSYINTRDTASGIANDTVSASVQDSGSIALTGADVLVAGPLNAFPVNENGTSYADGGILLTASTGDATVSAAIRGGQVGVQASNSVTIGAGSGIDSDGNEIDLLAGTTIALPDGTYLNSRETTPGNINNIANVSTGASGIIDLSAPAITLGGALDAFVLNGGGSTFAAGTIKLEGLTTAELGSGGTATLTSFDTAGASLIIVASQSIVLDSDAYINTRQTGSGTANDTASYSTGDAGDITLDAPAVTLNGQLNAFARNGNGSSYASGTITLQDLITADFGGANGLPATFETNGANLVVNALGSFTLEAGAIINTRQVAPGANPANDSIVSTGNSGSIVVGSPRMTFDAVPDTSANGGFQAGSLTLAPTPAGLVTINLPTVDIGTSASANFASIDSDGANVTITAAQSITIESGAYINTRLTGSGNPDDTTTASIGNSGDISLTAPTLNLAGRLDAFAVNSGTSFTSGTISIAGLATAVVGSGGNLPSFDTGGAGLSISGTGSIAVIGYINTRQTGSGAANDTTGSSTGDSGDITLDAPRISLSGALNAFALNTGGSTYNSGTITLAGLGATTIGAGGTLPSFDTNGANLVIDASSIAFESGGYINTRQTGSGAADDTTSLSAGASGNITLDAPTIAFGGQLNAFALNNGTGFASGTITLSGFDNFTISSSGNVAALATNGANLTIVAADGILLDTSGEIDTRQTGGIPGNVTLDAPAVTVKGTIAAFSTNSAYPSGTITLEVASIDIDGTDQPGISTNGANLAIIATTSITIGGSGSIDTRQLNGGGHSTGNSGSISFSAPNLALDGTLNLLAVNVDGTSYGSGTLGISGIANVTVGGGAGATLPSFATGGAGLSITATESITIASGAYINTRATGFGGDDTTDPSIGNSGNITLEAPSVTIDGALNAFALISGSSTYKSGTIALSGPSSITIGAGGLPSFDTNGANLSITATDSITLASGAYINTRATGHGDDDTADAAIGDSGAVSLTAPSITIAGMINAQASSGGTTSYTDGNITLTASASQSLPSGLAQATTSIVILGKLAGGNIDFESDASAISDYDDAVAVEAIADTFFSALGLSAGYVQSDAQASVKIESGASVVGSGNVTLNAYTTSNAEDQAFDLSLTALFSLFRGNFTPSVIVGETTAIADAEIDSGATVSSGGTLTVRAHNSDAQQAASFTVSTQSRVDVSVSYGSGDEEATATIDPGATVSAGNARIVARNDNSFDTSAENFALGTAVAGVAVAVNDPITSAATATLGTTIGGLAGGATGSWGSQLLVEADSLTTDDAAQATTITGTSLIDAFFVTATAGANNFINQKLGQAQSNSATTVQLRVAAALALTLDNNQTATATIDGAPTIVANGPVAVVANVVDDGVRSDANAEAASRAVSKGTAASPATLNGVSAAVAVFIATHTADAEIGSGTNITAPAIGIDASTTLPIDITWLDADSFDAVFSHLNLNAGIANDILTSFADSTVAAGNIGVTGSVDYFQETSDTTAWVGKGAVLNTGVTQQAVPWTVALDTGNDATLGLTGTDNTWETIDGTNQATDSWNAAIGVSAMTAIATLDVAGNISVLLGGTQGASSNAKVFGGAAAYVDYDDTTLAGIAADAAVTTDGGVEIASSADDRAISVTPAAGHGASVAGDGMLALLMIDDKTYATIADSADIDAASITINATETLSAWSAAGAVEFGNADSFGIGLALEFLTTDTEAFVGDNSSVDPSGALPSPFTAPTPGLTTDSLSATAVTDGQIGAFGIAGAQASTGSKTDQADSGSPSGGGQASGMSAVVSQLKSLFEGLPDTTEAVNPSSLDTSSTPATTPTTTNNTSTANNQPNWGIGVSGSAAAIDLSLTTLANVNDATVTLRDQGAQAQSALSLSAIDDTFVLAGAGAFALVSSGTGGAQTDVSVAGSLALLISANDTGAGLSNDTVKNFDAVTLQAIEGGQEIAAALDLAAAWGSNEFGKEFCRGGIGFGRLDL